MSPPAAAPPARPDHLQVAALAAVFLGGAGGTALRWLAGEAFGPASPTGWTTWFVNVSGSLAIGWLAARLDLLPGSARQRWWQLCLMPGLLGGYTTYSALALDAWTLLASGQVGTGLGYALSTVVAGALATLLGLSLGRGARRAAAR